MAIYNDGNVLAVTAGEALAAYRLVKLSGTTAVYADAVDIPDGITGVAATANGATASVTLLNSAVRIMVASEAIDAGESVATANDGKIQDAVTNATNVIGKALEASTGNGDEIAVLVNPLLFNGTSGS